MTLTIRTHHDVCDPLESVPTDRWRDMALKKAHHVKKLLHTNIDEAMPIMDDLEKHKAWEAAGMSKDFYLRQTCGVSPEHLKTVILRLERLMRNVERLLLGTKLRTI